MPWSYSLLIAVGHRHRPLLVGGHPVVAQCRLGPAGDLVRQAHGVLEGVPLGNDAVGEAHAQRFFAAHAPARQDEVESVAVAEQPGQSDGAAVHERDPPSPAVHTEHRVFGGHAQVAPRRQFQASRHGVALHRGDDRLVEQHPGGTHRAVAVGLDATHAGQARARSWP